jgi:hypothetical protein
MPSSLTRACKSSLRPRPRLSCAASAARRLFTDAIAEEREKADVLGLGDDAAAQPFEIELKCSVFEDKAREHNCYEVGPFYNSATFTKSGYSRILADRDYVITRLTQ